MHGHLMCNAVFTKIVLLTSASVDQTILGLFYDNRDRHATVQDINIPISLNNAITELVDQAKTRVCNIKCDTSTEKNTCGRQCLKKLDMGWIMVTISHDVLILVCL